MSLFGGGQYNCVFKCGVKDRMRKIAAYKYN